jgi:hypothetical protein
MNLPADTTAADIDVVTQGAKAAREGMPIRTCPHVPGSREANFWIAGWALTEPAAAVNAIRKLA